MTCPSCRGKRLRCDLCNGTRIICGPCETPEEQAREDIGHAIRRDGLHAVYKRLAKETCAVMPESDINYIPGP